MRRAAVILVLGALFAGCGGSEDTAPTAETVEGEQTQTQTQTEPEGEGDPAAGEQVFAQNGCGSCHVFGPAGSSGTTGPNLDELPMLAENAGEDLQAFTREAIENPNAYVEEGYPEGLMPTADLDDQELTNLVAFLTQS